MNTLFLIVQGLLGLIFVGAGGAKLAGADRMKENFATFDYPTWFMYVTGLFELGGAVGLLIGFWWTVGIQWGALLLIVTMIGAVWTELFRRGEGPGRCLL
ncbi:MAG: DoxX family protein [Salinibacter sp.]